MKVLITGASSGIGRDIAREFAARGCELILTARRRDRLEELAKSLPVKTRIICADLEVPDECYRLYEQVRKEKIGIFINNAGFGLYGRFWETQLEQELSLLDLNVRAAHILFKLFLRDFVQRDSGYILNVASSAGFFPGPGMAAYYASKAYLLRLTEGVAEELRRAHSRVYVGAFCPGPVRTEFNQHAGVRFRMPSLTSACAARRAVNGMLQRKTVIIPDLFMKTMRFSGRFVPDAFAAKLCARMQKRGD